MEGKLNNQKEQSIVISPWPAVNVSWIDEQAEDEIQLLQTIISNIRNIRAEMNVPPGKEADIYLRTDKTQIDFIIQHKKFIHSLAKVRAIHPYDKKMVSAIKASTIVRDVEIFIPLAELIDIDKEKNRLKKEINRLETLNTAINKKLRNTKFIEKAPDTVVQKEKDKLINNRDILESVTWAAR